jgi:hypothetical protein
VSDGVIDFDRWKGKEKLKEYFRGFRRCPDCHLYHEIVDRLPSYYCLPERVLREAHSFPVFEWRNQKYFLSEREMINFAVYHGIVPK